MTTKRIDKRPLCHCHVWSFPHHLSITMCEPDADEMDALRYERPRLWELMADRMDMDCVGDDPGSMGYVMRKDAMEAGE